MAIQRKTAYKMAIAVLRKVRQDYAFTANMGYRMSIKSSAITIAKKKVSKYNQAIAILKEDMENV